MIERERIGEFLEEFVTFVTAVGEREWWERVVDSDGESWTVEMTFECTKLPLQSSVLNRISSVIYVNCLVSLNGSPYRPHIQIGT